MAKAQRYRKVEGEKMSVLELGGSTSKKFLPRIHFNLTDLPEAKHWEVGKVYDLNLQVKQVSIHRSEEHSMASFEIVAVKVPGSKGAVKTKAKRYA